MQIVIDGVNGLDKGVIASTWPDLPIAEQATTYLSADGRDGSLAQDNGLQDVSLVFDVNFMSMDNVYMKQAVITAWMKNGHTVSVDEWPFEYRYKHVTFEATKNTMDVILGYTVTFVCDPRAFLKNVQNDTATGSHKLTNPGTYQSQPLIHVYGTGTVDWATIAISGFDPVKQKQVSASFRLDMQKPVFDVDCELMECSYLADNMNQFMDGDFPLLYPGDNQITVAGPVATLVIEPRWCYA